MKRHIQEKLIAEFCGWRDVDDHRASMGGILIAGAYLTGMPPSGLLEYEPTPSYFSDLNDTHQAEKKLSHHQYRVFVDHLAEILVREECYAGPANFTQHATAEFRCEALLKTIDLWEEEE